MTRSRVHDMAARGFDAGSDAYERARPDYPLAAVERIVAELHIREGRRVLDVGAGTGKLTRMLVPTGARLFALEPVQAMRERLLRAVPGVEIVEGTAEEIALPDAAVDAVVVAQAFHWFDGTAALRELHRVLVPGGRLGLVWNMWDESADWVRQVVALTDPCWEGIPRERTGEWRRAFSSQTWFGPLEGSVHPNEQRGDVDMMVDRVASISVIASLPLEEREMVLGKVRRLLETHPETSVRDEIVFPYRTEVYWCERL